MYSNVWRTKTIYKQNTSALKILEDEKKLLFLICYFFKGFGMLESGCVSLKNEVNIMMKNVVDVVLGGLSYWAFGYGLR